MKYYFYNPETKQSEGPYSIDMLRELVSKEQILPESKLCPPGGKKWIDAAEIGELFSPAPIPNISEENDDFVHPLSKKGILKIKKYGYITLGICLLLYGIPNLCLSIYTMYTLIPMMGSMGVYTSWFTFSFAFLTLFELLCSALGFFLINKGRKIKLIK
ncbi:MAG: GYF domain-containing protein [Verrucomicrobiota bacterium]|nr:GYF domain-containing protein [Verrucomicrobiota bacterium]